MSTEKKHIYFLGIGGTLWRGQVRQILHSGKTLPVRNLTWTVRPAALLTGTLKADFKEQQTPLNRGNMELNLLTLVVALFAAINDAPMTDPDAEPRRHLRERARDALARLTGYRFADAEALLDELCKLAETLVAEAPPS